jgi:hypothetical protein
MATTVATPFFTESRTAQLDDLLYEVCEDLQLGKSRYKQAEERYQAVSKVLESKDSPFRLLQPRIYPQGSMRLGTTVKPWEGPHDLDFVFEIALPHDFLNPMTLFKEFYAVLTGHGTYREMASPKKRCVRITYANEFYMDILPACKDSTAGGTCIRVPDRDMRDWTASNPIGYADWFHQRCALSRRRLFAKADPLPVQQDTEEKSPLQLAVQLIKRWRDLYYEDKTLAPISIVLTTLAGSLYQGDDSVSQAVAGILSGICQAISTADLSRTRLKVFNPSHPVEDLSERWDTTPEAYDAFKSGIRAFRRDWDEILASTRNVNKELETLFGEPVQKALVKQAQKLQEARGLGLLGVRSTGIISSLPAAVPIRPNTFHGKR